MAVAVLMAWALPLTTASAALPPPPASPGSEDGPVDVLTPWGRMKVAPGEPRAARLYPPRKGRHACVEVDDIAAVQLFGDSAIELFMRDGGHWRMVLADKCPALRFYQGFYYRRSKANKLCAGRDVLGARSGGECRIASIIRVRLADQPLPGP